MKTADLKKQAAEKSVEWVQSGMVLGLGTGSTTRLAIQKIGAEIQAGHLTQLVGIPTSRSTQEEAERAGIQLSTLEVHPSIDLTIDGADEVDPQLDVIKGGGGALLREKIVAQASRQVLLVVDESKLSPTLGTSWALPVEVIPFGWGSQRDFLASLAKKVQLRTSADGRPFLTDEGNYVLDCEFGPIADPESLANRLKSRAGIVEHGLFLGIASDVIVAGHAGIRHLQRPSSA